MQNSWGPWWRKVFGDDEGGRLEGDTLRDTVVTLAIGDVCRAMAALG